VGGLAPWPPARGHPATSGSRNGATARPEEEGATDGRLPPIGRAFLAGYLIGLLEGLEMVLVVSVS
jgi:hypothetical protein